MSYLISKKASDTKGLARLPAVGCSTDPDNKGTEIYRVLHYADAEGVSQYGLRV